MSPQVCSAPSSFLPFVERRHRRGLCHDPAAGARKRYAEYSKTCVPLTTGAPFNFHDCWITAPGVPVLPSEAHRLQGQAPATRGYIRD